MATPTKVARALTLDTQFNADSPRQSGDVLNDPAIVALSSVPKPSASPAPALGVLSSADDLLREADSLLSSKPSSPNPALLPLSSSASALAFPAASGDDGSVPPTPINAAYAYRKEPRVFVSTLPTPTAGNPHPAPFFSHAPDPQPQPQSQPQRRRHSFSQMMGDSVRYLVSSIAGGESSAPAAAEGAGKSNPVSSLAVVNPLVALESVPGEVQPVPAGRKKFSDSVGGRDLLLPSPDAAAVDSGDAAKPAVLSNSASTGAVAPAAAGSQPKTSASSRRRSFGELLFPSLSIDDPHAVVAQTPAKAREIVVVKLDELEDERRRARRREDQAVIAAAGAATKQLAAAAPSQGAAIAPSAEQQLPAASNSKPAVLPTGGSAKTLLPNRSPNISPRPDGQLSKPVHPAALSRGENARGFRNSLRNSFQNLLGLKDPSELDAPAPSSGSSPAGTVAYPEKIVKRLQAEAKKISAGLGSGYEDIISLAPDKAKCMNVDKKAFAFWKGTIAGPKGTIYDMATVDFDVFVGPDYPFKGPTITYEDHVVEFVVGKNQTDPRERNILWGWTPAMGIADAVVEIGRIIQGQHLEIVRDQLELERKRREKVAKLQQQALSNSGTQPLCLDVGTPSYGATGSARHFDVTGTTGTTAAANESGATEASAEPAQTPLPSSTTLPPISGKSPVRTDLSMSLEKRVGGLDERLANGATVTATNEGGLLVVKLQPAKALPRRGSFRASFGQKEMIEEIGRQALAGGASTAEVEVGARAAAGVGLGLDIGSLLAERN